MRFNRATPDASNYDTSPHQSGAHRVVAIDRESDFQLREKSSQVQRMQISACAREREFGQIRTRKLRNSA
jgi:hypothetical protein